MWDKILAEHEVGDESPIMGPFFGSNVNRAPLSPYFDFCILVESELHSCTQQKTLVRDGRGKCPKIKSMCSIFYPFEGCPMVRMQMQNYFLRQDFGDKSHSAAPATFS